MAQLDFHLKSPLSPKSQGTVFQQMCSKLSRRRWVSGGSTKSVPLRPVPATARHENGGLSTRLFRKFFRAKRALLPQKNNQRTREPTPPQPPLFGEYQETVGHRLVGGCWKMADLFDHYFAAWLTFKEEAFDPILVRPGKWLPGLP